MKEFTQDEKGSLIFNYVFYLANEKGFDTNDEIKKYIGILEMCEKSEYPVPKQLLPLNELKDHLRNTENIFPIRDARIETTLGTHNISEMMLNEIDTYFIDFSEETIEIIK